MAEIHVEPKKASSSTNWIWIVLVLLIAAAVVYYFVTRKDSDDDIAQPVNTTGAVLQLPVPVATPVHHTVMYL
jgi:uncharacterized membrane protein